MRETAMEAMYRQLQNSPAYGAMDPACISQVMGMDWSRDYQLEEQARAIYARDQQKPNLLLLLVEDN